MSISIELYARVKKTRSDSFTTLAPSGKPAETKRIDPDTGEEFSGSRKGVKVGRDYVAMTDEALEQINAGTKTRVLKPEAFCPLNTIALDLAIDRFYVRPQKEVAGADQSLNIVWNGLKATGLAWCTQMSIRGGHDAVLVLYADDSGLYAALLPFEEEVYPAPSFEFTDSRKAGDLFAAMVEQEHDVTAFDRRGDRRSPGAGDAGTGCAGGRGAGPDGGVGGQLEGEAEEEAHEGEEGGGVTRRDLELLAWRAAPVVILLALALVARRLLPPLTPRRHPA
jgi:hypothetical protein